MAPCLDWLDKNQDNLQKIEAIKQISFPEKSQTTTHSDRFGQNHNAKFKKLKNEDFWTRQCLKSISHIFECLKKNIATFKSIKRRRKLDFL